MSDSDFSAGEERGRPKLHKTFQSDYIWPLKSLQMVISHSAKFSHLRTPERKVQRKAQCWPRRLNLLQKPERGKLKGSVVAKRLIYLTRGPGQMSLERSSSYGAWRFLFLSMGFLTQEPLVSHVWDIQESPSADRGDCVRADASWTTLNHQAQ